MTKKMNESTLWREEIDERNKSYLTSVLHFFYYRNNKKSWEKEEVLTWELIRALDILPEQYFLNKFLSLTENKIDFTSDCISSLQQEQNHIEIHEYPRLGFSGLKRNAASDIEISNEGVCLWIEAKTKPGSEDELMEQIERQRSALKDKHEDKTTSLIVLVPDEQKLIEPHLITIDRP